MHFILLIAGVYGWVTFSTLMHELAHLTMGRVMGLRPKALYVGMGRKWLRMRVRGVEVVFAVWPIVGSVRSESVPFKWMRWRGSAYAIAGLLANGAMAWGLWQILERDLVEGVARSLVKTALMLEVFVIVANVIPGEMDAHGTRIGNDGRQFLDYITGRMARLRLSEYEMEIRRYDPDFDVGKSLVHRGDSKLLEVHEKAMSEYTTGHISGYLEAGRISLESGELLPGERAAVLDSMACKYVQHGHDSARAGAMAWAEEAYRMFPASRTLCGTYGSILIESGSYQAGMDILKPCTGAANSQMDRGIACCFMAKAHHRLGNTEEARSWLRQAGYVGGCEDVFAKIAGEIEGKKEPGDVG